ncbi:MAG: hypothetical protein ACOVS5_00790 [Oligoflexus sp.]|jgi:hypothetical protein
MTFKNMAVFYLSGTIALSMLIHACQGEGVKDTRNFGSGAATPSAPKGDDSKPGDSQAGPPADGTIPPAGTPTPGTPAAPASFTMSWDVSTDAAIGSYKVFVVPPDRNPRFPGKTDVPIPIKTYPLAMLQRSGQKYSVTVSSDEVKTALGATTVNPNAYCFTIVAVNGVGNSAHSPLICPP